MDCIRKSHKKENIPLKMEEKSSIREERLLQEIDTLRKELKCVHDVYSEGIKLRDSEINDLHSQIDDQFNKNENLYEYNQDLLETIHKFQKNKEKINKEKEEWIGRTLKFQYLFIQMKKIGLKQSEDIFECFEDIEVPEVSIRIRDKFIPTAQTDNIDYEEGFYEDSDDETISEEDPDIIGEYINDMNREINNIDNQIRDWINNTPELFNSTITIQRYFRGYKIRKYNKIMSNSMKNNNYDIEKYAREITDKYPQIFRNVLDESFTIFVCYIQNVLINTMRIQRIYRGYRTRKSVIFL
tara:strand:- start:95 stop:988 length:894 start_codon:yes stop_codon:yes gene_type:complete